MKINYILFDLDNTLYPADSGLFKEIDRRMTVFVSRLLNLPPEEAESLRRYLSSKYGTTLSGLTAEYNLKNTEEYLREVHPKNVELYIKRDEKLIDFLKRLKIEKSILTNSPREHAERVLNVLGIKDYFQYIFDIRLNNLMGKPNTEVYLKVLAKINRKPEETLFIDDLPSYLMPFKKLGGNIILIDRYHKYNNISDIPVIHDLEEIFNYI